MNKKMIALGIYLVMTIGAFGGLVQADTNQMLTPEVITNQNHEGVFQFEIPEAADKIIKETEQSVVYQIDEGVLIENQHGGQDLVAPVVVSSEIISQNGNHTEGVTTIVAELQQAVPVSQSDELSVSGFWDYLDKCLTPVVYAKDNTTTGSKNDSALSVKLTTTVYWTSNNGEALVTKVTGGYTLLDSSVKVTSSSVVVGTSANFTTQRKTISLGTAKSWTKVNGRDYSFKAVPYDGRAFGSVGGASYTVNLSRGTSSKWSVTYHNTAWSK